jgi:two-component system sporulation sensor kinase A
MRLLDHALGIVDVAERATLLRSFIESTEVPVAIAALACTRLLDHGANCAVDEDVLLAIRAVCAREGGRDASGHLLEARTAYAMVMLERGRPDAAQAALGRGSQRPPSATHPLHEVWLAAENIRGAIDRANGRLERAQRRLRQVVAHARPLHSAFVHAHEHLAMVCMRSGRMEEALMHLERAVFAARRIGDVVAVMSVHGRIAELLAAVGMIAPALRTSSIALRMPLDKMPPHVRCRLALAHVRVIRRAGEQAHGDDLGAEYMRYARAHGLFRCELDLWVERMDAAMEGGSTALIRSIHDEYEHATHLHAIGAVDAHVQRIRAELAMHGVVGSDVTGALERAVALATKVQDVACLTRVHIAISRYERLHGRWAEALSAARRALQVARRSDHDVGADVIEYVGTLSNECDDKRFAAQVAMEVQRREADIRRRTRTWEQRVSALEIEFVRFVADVAERRESDEELKRLRERLAHVEDRHREHTEVMEILAHDVKNCVGALRMMSMSYDGKQLDGEAYRRHTLAVADELVILSTQIVRTLRDDVPVHEPVVVDVDDVLQEAVGVVDLRRSLKNIRIDRFVDGDVRVRADAFAVREILVNILTNAIQHTPDGGGVRVDVVRRGMDVDVVVHDDGPGVTADRPSVDAAEDRTGVGLRLTQQLVARHHGRFEIGTHPNGGALVRIGFPAADGPRVNER